MSTNNTLYLVDGSSYIYRAYHALPNLTNSAGEPTGALLGVANMLRRLLKDAESDNIAVVFDAKGPTFRHEMYAEYKANRPPMPLELRQQVESIHEIVRLMGLPLIEVPGVEADDVIGTLANRATDQKINCVISTGDKDMAQLVNDHVSLVNTMTDTSMDADGVVEKFGVTPEQIVDYLALTGDKADNIPGVEKCGPKTAAKWLNNWQDLDGVIANAPDMKGKIGEYLREALETLPLSKDLATIRGDLDLDLDVDQLKRGPVDEVALREFLQRNEFNSWLRELGTEETPQAKGKEPVYTTILDMPGFNQWLDKLQNADLIAFDTETTSLDPMQAELVGLSFAIDAFEAVYIPVGHNYPGAPDQLDRDMVLEALRPLLEGESPKKVGQHIKYDMNVLSRYDLAVQGVAFDTMLESYVLNSTGSRHDMDSLALKYLGHKTTHYEDIAGKGAKQIPFSQVSIEDAGHYAAEDADITLRLHQHLWPKLQAEPALEKVLEEIEIPLIPVLARMEQTGVLIDGAT
ncbi:MAG: 5'-3' exonuclease H3TH domain-containing protein, partial [Lysobacterales bacterium]